MVHPGQAPEQDCYYQEMPSRSSGQGVPPGKAPEQDYHYQEKRWSKIFITRKCLPEALATGSPRKGTRRRLFLPGNAFQRLWRGIPPRKSSRTRLLIPGNAFQRPGQGVPPGTALEQDRSYQEMPSRGFGQGVPQERL